jgi:ABC-type antimicrobial peptide transport system permease subunit
LILTGLGVYGVVASRAARRTKEIGIRVALGAARGQVVVMVVTEGARLGLLGLVIGIPAALVTTRVMRSLLFDVDPWDPSALVAAIAMLCLAIAVATLLPASRAVRISPASSLRQS